MTHTIFNVPAPPEPRELVPPLGYIKDYSSLYSGHVRQNTSMSLCSEDNSNRTTLYREESVPFPETKGSRQMLVYLDDQNAVNKS